MTPTETVANTKLCYNDNGNPPPNTSYPTGCTPLQTAGSNNVYKLNATSNKTGLEFMIKVMAGDKLDIFGKSYYLNTAAITNANSTTLDVLSLMTNLLLAPSNAASDKGITASQLNTINNGVIPSTFFRGSNNEASTTVPKAYINYIFFDDQFKYAGGGASRVGTSGSVKDHWYVDALLQNISAPKNGYIFVYVSNESNFDVFFDNLQVIHKPGPILEETHYYAFGLTMAGISSKAAGNLINRNKFNGGNELQSQEFSDGSGLELYDAKNRMYDPQIGRFEQLDPLGDMSQNISPYVFGSDNPISINDPLGLEDSTHVLPTIIVGYIKGKWSSFTNWFTGGNVGYTGSGWGHGPRQWLSNHLGLGNNASNLFELGLQSQLQASHVNLTGGLLNKLKSDPAMIAFQKKIIAALKADPRFGKLTFVLANKQVVGFGGQRWSSPNENWGALNGTNPALHGETWEVAGNELTWAVRHATVKYTATVKTDGTAVISYHLSDRLDLTPGNRSDAYNNITTVTGFMYHDVAGGNRNMEVNADWQTRVQ